MQELQEFVVPPDVLLDSVQALAMLALVNGVLGESSHLEHVEDIFNVVSLLMVFRERIQKSLQLGLSC